MSSKFSSLLSDFIALTKPGIAFAVLFSTLAGYSISADSVLSWRLFHLLLGTAGAAFGAGTLNMVLEVESDGLMQRTASRALPSGRVPIGVALVFGLFVGSFGVVHLCSMVNLQSGFWAAMSLLFYLALYTPLKKVSSVCIWLGAVSGALPVLIGQSAALGRIDVLGISLFLVLFFWQFPHLWALYFMYQEDYKKAQIFMVPFSKNNVSAAWALGFSVLLFLASLLPFLLQKNAGYLVAVLAADAAILYCAWQFYRQINLSSARRLFFATLFYIPFVFGALLIL